MLILRPIEQDQIARERTLDPGVAQVGPLEDIPGWIALGDLKAWKRIVGAPELEIREEELVISALDGNNVFPDLGPILDVGEEHLSAINRG